MQTLQEPSLSTIARKPGFVPLWISQCLLSFNDNCFKILVSLVAVDQAHKRGLGNADLPLVVAAFLAPFLLFSGVAGRLADTVSKSALLRWMKAAEVVAMVAGTLAMASQNLEAMLAVVFLMGLHSTFYGPARAGLTPELVGLDTLAGANGLLDMGSYFSIVLGTLAGTLLFAHLGAGYWQAGLLLTTLAAIGFLVTLRLPPGVAAAPRGQARLLDGLRHLAQDRPLSRAVAGIASFWFLGGLMQMLVLLLAKETLRIEDSATGLLLAALAIGIGLGSALAGRLSARGIELGLLPLGGVGIVLGLFTLASADTFSVAMVALVSTGLSAGLWIVPLDAYLQFRTKPEERGRIVGASSFVNTIGTLAAPALLWGAQKMCVELSVLLYIAAAFGALCTLCAVLACGRESFRFVVLGLLRVAYRIRFTGAQNIPSSGGALLVANHVTFLDGLLLAATTQRFIRFLVIEKHYQRFEPIPRLFHAIPVKQGRPRDVVEMIARSRAALAAGELVCIFPEGDLTRMGNIQAFQRGMERIAAGLDVPVIPIHLGGLWGSVFSFAGGRLFAKWPQLRRYPVQISVGAPLPSNITAVEARQAVVELSCEPTETPLLHAAFIQAAKRAPKRLALADASGKSLTYRQALIASLLLARRLRKLDGDMLGVVLPASVAGALVNIASLIAGKKAVNLNFTSGPAAVESAIDQCGIRSILTSRLFLAKAKMAERPGMVFVEDLLGGISKLEKLAALCVSFLPAPVLCRIVPRGHCADLATVIFSSGSSGMPKGIKLSHQNVMSNIAASGIMIPLGPPDRIAGVLPFFHSFGFTFTLWFPMVNGIGGVYQMNPLDAKGVGTLVEKWSATVLLATPTFLANYTKVVTPEQFRSLHVVLAGAEKLREAVVAAFAAKFGVTPREGYGATEMAPVIAVSVEDVPLEAHRPQERGTRPSCRAGANPLCASSSKAHYQKGWMPNSVGRPLPGVAVRVVDPETGTPLPVGQEGLLLVKGANQMLGYWANAAKTKEVIRNGWYITGDVARVDEEGFIYLTGRLSRFSKIAGEMVPHGRVEDAIKACLSEDANVCVVAIADEERGEKLIALYEGSALEPAELVTALAASDLPKLWLPKRDALLRVEALPVLGTGKMDLRRAKEMAEERSKPLQLQN